jgi:protein-disulfide isomerase/DNA-binding XRE family transcriptional regulator
MRAMTDAELVSSARQELGITQTELAARLGVTPSAVSRWEAGMRALPGPARKLLEQLRRNKEPSSGGTVMRKHQTYGVVIGLFLLLGLAGYFLYQPAVSRLAITDSAGPAVEVKATDMVRGSPNAPVTLVEYASMTCPHCAEFQKDIIPQLTRDYIDTGKVKLIFREYPLDAAARMASAVARCLSGGQFFAFIDLLFKNQPGWIKDFHGNGQLNREDVLEGLTQMGRVAGLPADKVKLCSEDPKNLALVDANWMEGQTKYHVNSTPTFLVNGEMHGPMAYEEWKKTLDPLIKR